MTNPKFKCVLKHFNDLTPMELHKIITARNEVFVVEQNCIYQDCDKKDYYSHHLYFEHESEIAAYVRIIPKGISYEEAASIGRVLTTMKYRGTGAGKEIMKMAIKYIEDEYKEKKIRISAQKYAEGFYNSVGFFCIGDEYLEDDIVHIPMLYDGEMCPIRAC